MALKPYFEHNNIALYHGDALEILPALTMSFSAVVADPPYMIGSLSAGSINSKTGSWVDMMNASAWFAGWYRMVWQHLRHDGAFWSFTNWRSLPVVARAAHDAGISVTSLLVWDKEWRGPGGTQGLRPSYELVALMAKPAFAIADRGTPDIWRHKCGSYKPHGHPAEKPVGLVARLLQASNCTTESVVLDPFAGSGTTGEAAIRLGMSAVLVEGDERYCESAARRLSQSAFDAPPAPALVALDEQPTLV